MQASKNVFNRTYGTNHAIYRCSYRFKIYKKKSRSNCSYTKIQYAVNVFLPVHLTRFYDEFEKDGC